MKCWHRADIPYNYDRYAKGSWLEGTELSTRTPLVRTLDGKHRLFLRTQQWHPVTPKPSAGPCPCLYFHGLKWFVWFDLIWSGMKSHSWYRSDFLVPQPLAADHETRSVPDLVSAGWTRRWTQTRTMKPRCLLVSGHGKRMKNRAGRSRWSKDARRWGTTTKAWCAGSTSRNGNCSYLRPIWSSVLWLCGFRLSCATI